MLKGLFKVSAETHEKTDSEPTDFRLIDNTIETVVNKMSGLNDKESTRIITWLQKKLNKVEGHFVLTETKHANGTVAGQLYTKLSGNIISTCFFESPDYGNGDWAKTISPTANFTRITLEELCPIELTKVLESRLQEFECRASLKVIPSELNITKIGGIFAKLQDESYLTFISFDNYGGILNNNMGLTFSGELAEQLYRYYDSFGK